jgi:hypothetical protein
MKKAIILVLSGAFGTLALLIAAVIMTTDSATPTQEIAQQAQPVQKVSAPEPETTPEPLSPEEEVKQSIINNTPGLIAKETVMGMPADQLANTIIPATCEALETTPLASTVKIILADAALKNWGTDEKASENVAEGILKTALEPGRC